MQQSRKHTAWRKSRRFGDKMGGRRRLKLDGNVFKRHHSLPKPSPTEALPIFMVENPSRDFFHPLGESEIRAKLSSLPIPEELKITHIWLRRTKKGDYEAAQTHQATFIKGSGVWLIVLYAFPKDLKMRFGQRKPEQKELNFYARWTSDLQSDALGWHLVWQEQAIRDYYLNYLLPNEIGHLIESQFFRYYSKARLVRRENFAHEFAIRSLRTTTAFY